MLAFGLMTASIRRKGARDRGKGGVIIFFSNPAARGTRLSDFVAVGTLRLFARPALSTSRRSAAICRERCWRGRSVPYLFSRSPINLTGGSVAWPRGRKQSNRALVSAVAGCPLV